MSQLPEPPPNIPRIVDVQDPGTGHYIVMVRMPAQLAATFPKKAWGTPIESVGLAKQDSDRFPGHILVDTERLQGSPDIYWIFQKLNGPIWYTKSKETQELVPMKFRRRVLQTITRQEVDPTATPDELGVTTALGKISSSVVQDKDDTGKSLKVNKYEAISEGEAIAGQLFDPEGAIMDVTEDVVNEGTSAEVGVNIFKSSVDAFGNGLAAKTKQTARRRTNDGTTEEGWPITQTKVTGTDAEIPAMYADQVTSVETAVQVELQAANVDDLPEPPTPTGDDVQIVRKKINDWRYQEVKKSKKFNLTGEIVETDVEQRPFVTITQNTRGGATSVIPETGTGSSKLIWKAGQQKLFANMDQDSVAKPGLKGYNTSAEQWGSIVERTDYSENYQDGESSRVIFDDGETRVYEVDNLAGVTASGITLDKDPQQWGTARWDGEYSTAESSGADRSRVVWQRSGIRVYLNETVSIDVSGTTLDKDPQSWGSVKWEGSYAESALDGADRYKQVWRIGTKKVFLNETAVVEVSGGTKDKDPQTWGSLTWNGTYDTTASDGADRSRQVWRMGNRTVYLNETVAVSISGVTLDKDPQPWGTQIWSGEYKDFSEGDRSRQVWRLGDKMVYLNETVSAIVEGGTKDKDPQPWGTVTWTGTYLENENDSDRSRQVWRLGTKKVFLNENAEVAISGGTIDKDPQPWGYAKWTGAYGDQSTDVARSRQVWRLGDKSVFLNETVEAVFSGGTIDKDSQPWGTVKYVGTYGGGQEDGADRSRQVWRVGEEKVFLNEVAELSIDGSTVDLDMREWGSVKWEGSYASNPALDRTRQVFNLNGKKVYLNEEVSLVNIGGSRKEIDPNPWGSLIWDGSYSDAASTDEGDRSRQVFKIKEFSVYLNEKPRVEVLSGEFVSAREENALLIETYRTTYGLSTNSGDNTRSRVAFSIGTIRVYENTVIDRASKGERSYAGSVNVDLPPILNAIDDVPILRRDGQDSMAYMENVTPGYRGPMPCTITEIWQKDPGVLDPIQTFRPNSVRIISPLGRIEVGPTLHGSISKNVVIGTGHPIYAFSTYSYNFPPTEPTTWAGLTFLAHVESSPYQDGYIIRKYKVTA